MGGLHDLSVPWSNSASHEAKTWKSVREQRLKHSVLHSHWLLPFNTTCPALWICWNIFWQEQLPVGGVSSNRCFWLAMSEVSETKTRNQSSPVDCLSCRVIGTTVSFGASAFLIFHLNGAKPPVGLHRAMMIAFAGGFAALGVARAIA